MCDRSLAGCADDGEGEPTRLFFYQAAEKLMLTSVADSDIGGRDDAEQPYRMRKKAVQQGRSE